MNPKEKARELIDKYRRAINGNTIEPLSCEAKICTLICVEEIMNELGKESRANETELRYYGEVYEEITKY